ncbi:TonB-dependent receptor [Microbulbifer bruguierae]|uniref:TonB-dependent receptor n=1 Tax=Microbulbifer bruguierae TaxID=3029061 RepID=A0ABY8NB43_9GAMM|nr:TonB-dependent receptor [Microbulbifer bruguierae]WGL16139.1 TonB-dependent receptor [Microbulbifer bruguierae]
MIDFSRYLRPNFPRNFPRNKLALLVSLSICGTAAPALAQQAVDATALEEVSVMATPIRDSQKAAIDAKRDADNTVDVISADTIGRFPDQNLADSLGRVPGLAIERDQGQARYINFRGAPFRYTSLAIDGLNIPGAENGRVPRFDSFPAVITRRIDANKAIMPNMPGEAVSGYINIATFDPFAKSGWAVSTDVGMGNQELGDGDIEKLALRTSWSNDTVGFSLFASENSRAQTTDNREYDLELVDGEVKVNELDFRSYKVTREDRAYGGRFELRPRDSALERIFISSLYNEFQDFEERNQYILEFPTSAAGTVGAQQFALANRMLEDGLYENSTFTNTLGADFALGEWFVEARLNRTETENNMFLPIVMSRAGQVSASYDVSNLEDPLVEVTQLGTGAAADLSQVDYYMDLAYIVSSELVIDATKFKLDGEREVSVMNLPATVKVGVEMDERDADGCVMAAGYGAFPSSIDIGSFATDKAWATDFTNSIGGTYYDNQGLRAAWEQAVGSLAVEPAADQLISLEEQVMAGYAMVTTEFGWGNLVLGSRIENTDYSSAGPDGEYADSFTNVLPSAHLNVNLSDDVKLRVSASTGVSRPTYNEWRASAAVNLTDKIVVGGNPTLKAEEAFGGDIALEWYLGDASLVSAGAFTRAIDNVIYADSATIDGGVYLASAAGEEWTYTGYVNGDNGKLSGVELNVIAQADDLLPALSGFGVSANLTALDSEFETQSGNKFSLPGTSDLIFNTSVFYEMENFSIRLNHQYRDDWLSTTENDSMAEYWAEQKRMDLQVSYTLPTQIFGADVSLYANANNLTDERDVRYAGDERTPNQIESYGRRYLAGFRVNF